MRHILLSGVLTSTTPTHSGVLSCTKSLMFHHFRHHATAVDKTIGFVYLPRVLNVKSFVDVLLNRNVYVYDRPLRSIL